MRFDMIKGSVTGRAFAVEVNYLNSIFSVLNGDIKELVAEKKEDSEIIPSSYIEKRGNIAVIGVDGTTTKKNMRINAISGGYVGYDTITRYIEEAEANDNIDTIIFRVDTRGGDVAGADDLHLRIKNINKKTITFYENMGASAGIWWGSASDELYATEVTLLGSIGVFIGYRDKEDGDIVKVFSKNAPNKDCSLNGDCQERFKIRVDKYESVFIDRVSKATSMSVDKVINAFGKGGMIFAEEAKKAGFLNGIKTFEELIAENTLATMPPAGENSKSNNMEESMENRDDTTAGVKDTVVTAEETTALNNSVQKRDEIARFVISEGARLNSSKKVMLEALEQDDITKAENILLREAQEIAEKRADEVSAFTQPTNKTDEAEEDSFSLNEL